MPLTLAHPAAVLPLRRLGLPMTALVVGSMVPDIPVFLGLRKTYEVTHSLVGIVTLDLAITLVVVALWFALARDALVDLAPAIVRKRLVPHSRLTPRQWVLAVPAAVIGSATHVLWDSFTHPGRWGVERIGWLQSVQDGRPTYEWAQYACGVLGVAVVVLVALQHLHGLAPLEEERPERALSPYALFLAPAAAAVIGLGTVIERRPDGLRSMAFFGVVNSVMVFAAVAGLACLAWQVRARLTPAR